MVPKRNRIHLALLAAVFVGGLLVTFNYFDGLGSHKSSGNPANRAVRDLKTPRSGVDDRLPPLTQFEPRDVGVFPDANSNSVKTESRSVDALFNKLESLTDPMEKRLVREEMSDLKPTLTTLNFLLGKLHVTENEDQKTQIYSIITLMNGADIVDEIKQLASRTEDEELFLSLVYSLRQGNTEQAKKALFELMVENHLQPSKGTQSVLENQGLSGLYRALMDTMRIEDVSWVKDYLEKHAISEAQRLLLQEFMKNQEQFRR